MKCAVVSIEDVRRESLRVSLLVADLKPNVDLSGGGFERAVLRPSLFVRVMNAGVFVPRSRPAAQVTQPGSRVEWSGPRESGSELAAG